MKKQLAPLPISGIVPCSAADFPGALSAVLFCQGCPWRCRYCHNPHLQPFSPGRAGSWEEAERFLKRRQGLLDAVVFSGGEPSLHPGLFDAILAAKSLGFRIGLHTAGIAPVRLAVILPLVDWVGMDIKAPFSHYARITGDPRSGVRAERSARLVVQSGVPHQFRTTVHPKLLSQEDLRSLAEDLRALGASPPVLQPFRKQGCLDRELNKN